jgi:hypothetical protein
MRTPILACFLATQVLSMAARPVFSQPPPPLTPSALEGYTKCQYEGGLTAIVVERAPQLPMDRPVVTAAGTKYVSVADGYRIILEFPYTSPFVNLKVESSVSGHYTMDKAAVLEQVQGIVGANKNGEYTLDRTSVHGIEVLAVNRSKLEGGTIGLYTFFDDARTVIATAYILNQLAEERAFHDLSEFRALRDRFVTEFTSCMSELHVRRNEIP